MLREDGIKRSMKKLGNKVQEEKTTEGDVEYLPGRGGENRYTYRYLGETVFTFGMTRGSKGREIDYRYVPRQMGLNNSEYKEFHDCTLSKREYNKLLKERGKIQRELIEEKDENKPDKENKSVKNKH